jgi:hypothetical protein
LPLIRCSRLFHAADYAATPPAIYMLMPFSFFAAAIAAFDTRTASCANARTRHTRGSARMCRSDARNAPCRFCHYLLPDALDAAAADYFTTLFAASILFRFSRFHC